MGTSSESLSHTVLNAVGRTTSFTSSDIQVSARSISLHINTTAFGSSSNTITINGKDLGSGTYYSILASAAIGSNSLVRLKVSPHLTASANAVAQDLVPDVLQITVTAGNGNPSTYTLTLVEHC